MQVEQNRQEEQVPDFDDDINIFVEDEYEQDDPAKYEEINKLIEKNDTPCPDWSEEDNMIIKTFLHSVDDQALANKSIPKNI